MRIPERIGKTEITTQERDMLRAGLPVRAKLDVYKRQMQEFLDIRYHVKDIALKELTPAFISDFEMFLRTDKHCCTNTAVSYTHLDVYKRQSAPLSSFKFSV